MAPSQRIKELFNGYLRRELSPVEVEELVLLLGRADAEDSLNEPMRRIWDELKSRPVGYDVDWDRMYRQVSQSEEGLCMLGEVRQGRGGFWRRGRAEMGRGVWSWRVVAAVFLGLAGLAAYWSVAYRRPVVEPAARVPTAVIVNKDSVGKVTAMSWQTGENKKVIHLPDGSMVILNRHSSVEYRVGAGGGTGGASAGGGTGGASAGGGTGAASANGGTGGASAAGIAGQGGTREVTLNGEAYFDIVHRPEQPFLVHTGKIVTRVLGTAFNIKAYSTERSIEVTVDHGKVQVLKGGANMGMLSDKQQMRYEVGTESCHSQRVSLRPVMAWKPVEISFDDITMEEAARRIGERFKVGFEFVNPVLKECRVTATFYMEDDLDEIMTVICGVNQSKFRIEGSVVKIDGKGCN
ncbi:MAG TPA: FecR domain-containing protein [Puia sp.]|nr:FecR domain-containing protein [Puia sp.]